MSSVSPATLDLKRESEDEGGETTESDMEMADVTTLVLTSMVSALLTTTRLTSSVLLCFRDVLDLVDVNQQQIAAEGDLHAQLDPFFETPEQRRRRLRAEMPATIQVVLEGVSTSRRVTDIVQVYDIWWENSTECYVAYESVSSRGAGLVSRARAKTVFVTRDGIRKVLLFLMQVLMGVDLPALRWKPAS